MSTPHINAEYGDFAKTVLMSGDPLRAKWIAENFLHDVKQVANVRGILGFTGYTKNNVRISLMASGMGMPSIGIYCRELYEFFGVETIIRIGTCGSYREDIKLLDVMVCVGACTDSNWGAQYKLYGTYSAIADFDTAVIAVNKCKEQGVPYHAGNILSADVFYDEDPEQWKTWAKLGVMGVEMESYALYTTAARLNKKALCLLSVSDSFLSPEKLTSDQRVSGLRQMIEVAIATAEEISK